MDRRLDSKKTSINDTKQRYRAQHEIFLQPGMDLEDATFQPLEDEDCRAYILLTAEETLGDSEKVASWIWGDVSFVTKVQDMDVKQYMLECECIIFGSWGDG